MTRESRERLRGGVSEGAVAGCASGGGGFSEARLRDWQVPRKTVFCVFTDQGNIARVVIVDFIGGEEDENEAFALPPDQITLKVTLWKPSA
ncbi:hypothetical protein ABT154_07460 [Streptomyces sp. NPDC001728]|uniref:hypothetical protein n=1 Tax=Streptomyces sp. NPDC001728 TaxID=3154396 RepID=UPI00332FCC66